MKKTLNKLTYAKSGVNIKKADKLIGNLKKGANPKNPNVVAGIGGFSSLYALDIRKYTNPLIVAGTDGVGTKLKLAALLNEHRYIGQDLLAMCLNDVITSDLERSKEILEKCSDNLSIYTGDDKTSARDIGLGFSGNISVTANIVPLDMHNMCKLASEGSYQTSHFFR